MAVRSASRIYPTIRSFLEEWGGTLRTGAIVLSADTVDGEPAAEMKIDLILPLVGRVGPISGQVIQRLADGSTVLRVAEWPPPVHEAVERLVTEVDDIRRYLLDKGVVGPPSGTAIPEIDALRRRVRELESRPATVIQAPPARQGEAPAVNAPRDEDGNVVIERGLVVPDIRGLAPALSGVMGDRSLRDAMMELALERVTGLLTVEQPDGTLRWGFWHKGGPAAWRTEPIGEDEVLGILMFRANQLRREQLEESLDLMETNGVRQGEALIEMGVITFAQLVQLLQKQTEFVYQRVLREREGKWMFHVLEALPERFISPPLRVPSLLFRALRVHVKDMAAEELATTLRPWLDKYVYLAEGAERVISEMKTNAEEQAFFKILTSTSYRLRELFAVSNLSRSATAGMIWTLADLHLVEFLDLEADSRATERMMRVLADRQRAVTKGSLFESLDLHWICTTEEVEATWATLNADFGALSHGRWGQVNTPQVEQLHAAMRKAYDRLVVEATRREYRSEIIEKMKIEQSAEMLAKKGDMSIMKENSRESLDCYVKACELMPNIAEYREGLQRARQLR
ncbi:MAG: hypothetical protein EXR71_16640 [Myxococcales bacterium]|nr:hypothetical protein [Myxococcales bacterium]